MIIDYSCYGKVMGRVRGCDCDYPSVPTNRARVSTVGRELSDAPGHMDVHELKKNHTL